MAVCLNCGKAANYCLCEDCRKTVDTESLCRTIIEYTPGCGENRIWDQIASEMSNKNNFKNIVFSLAEDLPSPEKEYWKILSFAGENASIPKDNRIWLYKTYEIVKKTDGLDRTKMNRIKGLILGALFMDYRYEESALLIRELEKEEDLPIQVYFNLADFYSKTRRYDKSGSVIKMAENLYGKERASTVFRTIIDNNRKYRYKRIKGGQEYLPNPKENRDEARKAYMDYLISIGIDAESSDSSKTRSAAPRAIPKDSYPEPKEIRDADFDTFVAYDLETTGLSPSIDAIIEIGAIKVCGGKIVEKQEFVFQEFVHPYKKSLREEVIQKTGITKDDVKDAREMWEVFPDFVRFVGDNVLVGFNNVKFDSRFLARAGRYSNLIMKNPQFDVMIYANQFREELGISDKRVSLVDLAERLGIENPMAHRALADAITTAKVYLKLREMDKQEKVIDIDDLLSDLDNW